MFRHDHVGAHGVESIRARDNVDVGFDIFFKVNQAAVVGNERLLDLDRVFVKLIFGLLEFSGELCMLAVEVLETVVQDCPGDHLRRQEVNACSNMKKCLAEFTHHSFNTAKANVPIVHAVVDRVEGYRRFEVTTVASS